MVLVLFILLLASAASYKPAPPVKCGVNEYTVPCKKLCPPQNCDISYTSYICEPNPKCIPGCDCIEGYLRNDEKICVTKQKCPGLPEDALAHGSGSNSSATNALGSGEVNNASVSSFSSTTSSSSSDEFSSSSLSASAYSFTNGIVGGGMKRNCSYHSCTPTCSLPDTHNCPANSNPCNCPPGTIISEEGGKCVPIEECPKYANCKGDYNASFTDCPFTDPSTCAKPDAVYSNTTCGTLGCTCNPGYLLTEIDGHCVKPEDCPGGAPCGENETFVDCLAKCPSIYCPTDDSRGPFDCEPEKQCPSGCCCQKNYKRKSADEYICILASDCPAVNCTRPNEAWNPCPKPCFSDFCSEKNKVTKPGDCPFAEVDCSPQCICKPGFYRNGTDICVTAQECPPENLTIIGKSSLENKTEENCPKNDTEQSVMSAVAIIG